MDKSYYDQDFLPQAPRTAGSDAYRVANAAEYAAHHLGKISRNLEKLIAILEKKSPDKVDGGTF